MALDLSRFAKAFFEEAQEHLAALESLLVRLNVKSPDAESLNAIFRAVHSIKGGAAAFGHTDLADFTHDFESLLDRIRKGTLPLSKSMVDQFLRAGDLMRQQLAALEANSSIDAMPMQIMQDILRSMGSQGATTLASTESAPTASALPPAIALTPHLYVTLVLDRAHHGSDEQLAALSDDLRGLGKVESFESEIINAATIEVSFRLWSDELDEAELRESLEFLVSADSMRIVPVGVASAHGNVPAAGVPAAVATVSPPLLEADDDPDGAYEFFEPLPTSTSTTNTSATTLPGLADSDIALASAADASSIRINVDKVDQLINQVGELVIAEAMLTQAAAGLSPESMQLLSSALLQLQRNTRDLQESVLAIRMMPISFVFSRLPRLTRDLADRLGKEVDIHLTGEETELDKSVIEKIADPLTHLVRNAIDHGIESPDERVRNGKASAGRLSVRAAHAGGSVIISVSDDGGGLDRQRIVAKAAQLGFEDTEHWSDAEVWQLIFTPGFSTASAVTDVSGRGVGMDVVWQNVHALGGKTEIASTAGVGTTITIRLPLTLAILDGLSVSVSGETYIIALTSVMQSLQPANEEIRTVSGQRVVMVRDEYVPILSLTQLFNLPTSETPSSESILVVLEVDGLRAALEVDALVGQQQVVLKSLESNYRRVPGLAGATILGGGRVAMILDASYLVSLSHAVQRTHAVGRAGPRIQPATHSVLNH